METNGAREALRTADRAAAAPWIEYPPVPWWHPLFFAAYAAALTLSIGLLGGIASALVNVGLAGAAITYLAWYTRKRGTYPRGKAPQELRGPFALLFGGAALIAVAAWGIGALVSVALAAAVAALATGVLVARYEVLYARAAARTRERLA